MRGSRRHQSRQRIPARAVYACAEPWATEVAGLCRNVGCGNRAPFDVIKIAARRNRSMRGMRIAAKDFQWLIGAYRALGLCPHRKQKYYFSITVESAAAAALRAPIRSGVWYAACVLRNFLRNLLGKVNRTSAEERARASFRLVPTRSVREMQCCRKGRDIFEWLLFRSQHHSSNCKGVGELFFLYLNRCAEIISSNYCYPAFAEALLRELFADERCS